MGDCQVAMQEKVMAKKKVKVNENFLKKNNFTKEKQRFKGKV